jgi:hypothetical protein
MANTKRRKKSVAVARAATLPQELDGTYFLKLVLYLIIGSFWLKMTIGNGHLPIPFGLLVGLYFARNEKLQIDRKIEYALLLAAMLVGYFAPFGIYLRF